MCEIISVHSFRGGTGKSNLTANLAAKLTLEGKKVGVVDTDIQSPGIHVIFGLDEDVMNYSLNDYLWGNCKIEATAYDVSHVLKQEVNSCLYLIPSSIKAGQIARILREGYDVARLNDGLNELIRAFKLDYLLIDTHPGLNEETLLSIAISDRLVVIMRPDRQDFQGTAVTLEVARKLDMSNIMLVVNKALSSTDLDALQKNVENTYSTSVVGIIPLSEEIAQMGSRDIFCLYHPKHPLSLTVGNITSQIIGHKSMSKIGV